MNLGSTLEFSCPELQCKQRLTGRLTHSLLLHPLGACRNSWLEGCLSSASHGKQMLFPLKDCSNSLLQPGETGTPCYLLAPRRVCAAGSTTSFLQLALSLRRLIFERTLVHASGFDLKNTSVQQSYSKPWPLLSKPFFLQESHSCQPWVVFIVNEITVCV